ncbi:hypothetical protein FH608_004125 [Nonomuraea phyllanthi]|uniref:Uncharacterized protein n=1 Tax=Nonomuraea phyllanthi TaxID=2219224 RepID=A0A5C4WWZ9_9ACTN|nr:hypothetical protein [Nonomuraea phyllanthi]KAB8197722.1 hypothetical protein FH608_004125 [Nonomuraea phyllanthi]
MVDLNPFHVGTAAWTAAVPTTVAAGGVLGPYGWAIAILAAAMASNPGGIATEGMVIGPEGDEGFEGLKKQCQQLYKSLEENADWHGDAKETFKTVLDNFVAECDKAALRCKDHRDSLICTATVLSVLGGLMVVIAGVLVKLKWADFASKFLPANAKLMSGTAIQGILKGILQSLKMKWPELKKLFLAVGGIATLVMFAAMKQDRMFFLMKALPSQFDMNDTNFGQNPTGLAYNITYEKGHPVSSTGLDPQQMSSLTQPRVEGAENGAGTMPAPYPGTSGTPVPASGATTSDAGTGSPDNAQA